jgi:hypothetical protein
MPGMVHGVAGGALASATATGGHANAITLSTTAAQILGPNGQRQSIVFMTSLGHRLCGPGSYCHWRTIDPVAR